MAASDGRFGNRAFTRAALDHLRIRGRHDPPQRQELRVSIAEFISREFLNRELPLPSGTGIDLTLDTTLNVNQLVSDLLELNRARNGEASPTP